MNKEVKERPKGNKLEEAIELLNNNLSVYETLLERLEKSLDGLLLTSREEVPLPDPQEEKETSDIVRLINRKNEKVEVLNENFRIIIDRVDL